MTPTAPPLVLAIALMCGCDAASGPALEPPSITLQPSDTTVEACGDAAFTVAASGAPPLSFQWRKNGSPIPGADSNRYLLSGVVPADDGASFSVIVSNAAGASTSREAALAVTPSQVVAGPVVIADEGGEGIAVNDTTIAWTTGRAVHAAPKLCGRPARSIYERSSYMTATTAIALASDRVAWTDATNGTVWSGPLDGGAASVLVSLGFTGAYDITLANDRLYWSHLSNGIWSIQLAGGTAVEISPAGEADAVAADDLYLYWTDLAQHSVNRFPLDGGSAVTTLATDQNYTEGMAADGRYVYWGATDESIDPPVTSILRLARDGGIPTAIATHPYYALRLATDGAYVYWTAALHLLAMPGENAVFRVPVDGSAPPDVLATGSRIYGIAVDSQHVYWTERDGGLLEPGRIMRLAK